MVGVVVVEVILGSLRVAAAMARGQLG